MQKIDSELYSTEFQPYEHTALGGWGRKVAWAGSGTWIAASAPADSAAGPFLGLVVSSVDSSPWSFNLNVTASACAEGQNRPHVHREQFRRSRCHLPCSPAESVGTTQPSESWPNTCGDGHKIHSRRLGGSPRSRYPWRQLLGSLAL
jgi:hypothetical protein